MDALEILEAKPSEKSSTTSGEEQSRSIFDIEFVAFDTETTGLSPVTSRLVELSGVRFKLGDINVTTFSSLIDPECSIPPEVTNVHGITDSMVADAPKAHQVIPQFLEWIGSADTVLVAHNAPFDVKFLQFAIAKLGLTAPSHFVVDTLPLSRRVLKDAPNHRLQTLVEFLQLEAAGYHRALADSHHVRNVLTRVASSEYGLSTWNCLQTHGCTFRFDRDSEAEGGWFEPDPAVTRHAQIIRDAIAEGVSVAFVYQGARKLKKNVTPTAVLQNRGTFYLTGLCHRMKEERTYRVDKMFDVEFLRVSVGSIV